MKIIAITILTLYTVIVFGQLDHKFKSWKENEYVVTASKLNVRETPNNSAKILDKIPIGTKVLAIVETIPANQEQKNPAYCEIMYQDRNVIKKGYVSTTYLSQFYVEEGEEIILLKDISSGALNRKMLLLSIKENQPEEIGQFETYMHQGYDIRIRYTKQIVGVKRVIEVEYEDDDSCSSGFVFHTYIEMENGSYTKLPIYSYSTTEFGENTLDLQLPNDPFGSSNRLNIIETTYTYTEKGTQVKDITIKHKYLWNGTEWIVEN